MTEFEIRQLMYEEIQIAVGEFEFWVTASFAVIVAGYYAFKHLEPKLQKTVKWLYIATAAVFIVRWFVSIYKMYEYNIALTELGVDVGLQLGQAFSTLLQSSLMIFGTFAVVSFLKRVSEFNDSADP